VEAKIKLPLFDLRVALRHDLSGYSLIGKRIALNSENNTQIVLSAGYNHTVFYV
jgi:hypothetical protein